MTTKLIGNRVVAIGLMTVLSPLGAVLAGTAPPVDPATPPPARSVQPSASAPGPLAASHHDAPWLYENLIAFPPASSCPLKPSDDAQPAESTMEKQPALADAQLPGIVQNLRRVDRN